MDIDSVNAAKAAFSGVCAALTALWGWFGWLVIAWIFCMATDYATGSAAAIKNGEWASKDARDGIWHKIGAVVVVIVAAILDSVVRAMVDHFPGITLPFEYTTFFCPMVVVWCIITELGSIIENAGELGAPIPSWLVKTLAALKDKVDDTEGGTDDEPANE